VPVDKMPKQVRHDSMLVGREMSFSLVVGVVSTEICKTLLKHVIFLENRVLYPYGTIYEVKKNEI